VISSGRSLRKWRGCPALTAYIAVCAASIASSTEFIVSVKGTKPMLASIRRLPGACTSSEIASSSAWLTRSASGGLARGSSTANWSPPMRASRSVSRSRLVSAFATAINTRSPARWPCSSLTDRNPFRSSTTSTPPMP
jgi:hypothetical protein